MPLSTETEIHSLLAYDVDLADLVDEFVQELPRRIEQLRSCLQAGDRVGLIRAAHQLAGEAGSYGFSALAPHAMAVEEAGHRCETRQILVEQVEALAAVATRCRPGIPALA